jgi:hypothetical protein
MALLVTLLAHPAAAGQFAIHSGPNALSAHESSPQAVVFISPYDDAVLNDGIDHYYLVRDEAELQVSISVHKSDPHGAVRIAFDDGDRFAAAVDPSLSSVSLSPASLPADGVSMSQIVIIPRDASGVPLGAGLDIEIDTDALSPGFVCGPLLDMGDGSYLLQVASALPGSGRVWVSVEGIALDDEPALTFEYVGGASDLRELAELNLDGVSAAGGAFDNALEGIEPDDPGAEKVREAWDEALEGLAVLNEDDHGFDNDVVDNYLKSAIRELFSALDDPGNVSPEAIRDLIDELLDIARALAQFHFNRAVDSCGFCDPDEGGEICDAEDALVAGDAERTSADPDYEEAANQYGKTVDKALDALSVCAG